MNSNHIIATLAFYRLLEQPLSSVEIFRYLADTAHAGTKPTFCDIFKQLRATPAILEQNGFYFLAPSHKALISQRIKREKISSQKWKKVKFICRFLQYLPFVRGVGVTGSLTFNNARQESDFDLFVIAKPGRIWSARAIISVFLGLLNQKRFGDNTKNKVCLNCFLTSDALNIRDEIKSHNLYSSQEYGRLLPIFKHQAGLWTDFKQANQWIAEYLPLYPWTTETFHCLPPNRLADFIRQICEKMLDFGFWDEITEQILKNYQIKRIKKNLTTKPDDQIFWSDQYLFFHPHSKSVKILEEFNKIMCVPRYKIK